MTKIILRKHNSYVRQSWLGGETTEVYLYPEDGDYQQRNFAFRFSYATIEIEKSTFSNLNGFKRILIPTKDEITLINNLRSFKIKKNQPYFFAGSDQVQSLGVSEDINLIYRPEWQAQMKLISLPAKFKFDVEIVGVFALKGNSKVSLNDNEFQLREKDCLIIQNSDHQKLQFKVDNKELNGQVAIFCLKRDDSFES
ncbi:HutD family protein [Liquorilactobacillus sicerae]|uniref:HutD family protein n=1 Tax=Liquorilactobacillus sicerae TaxID=1416943 RepID=UPI0024802B9B|nr:HutD family protein [Liquorilactobacillus sicerae]